MASSQDVKLRGFLWTTRCVLSIVRDIVIILVMLAILWQVVTVAPKIMEQLNSLSQMNQNNAQNNLQNNQMPSGDNKNAPANIDVKGVADQMRNFVDKGDWIGAMGQLSIIKNNFNSLSPGQQALVKQLNQAIVNKDKNTFYQVYNQAAQS